MLEIVGLVLKVEGKQLKAYIRVRNCKAYLGQGFKIKIQRFGFKGLGFKV